jgi:hypothetical protein
MLSQTAVAPVLLRTLAFTAAAIALVSDFATAAPVRMAVLGDSLSNVTQVPGGAPNWISQLNSSFPGAFTFENKAVGGATSSDVVNNQLPAVLSLVENNQIDAVTTIIAGNDVTFMLIDMINGVAVNPATVVNTYVNNVKTVIDSIAAANPNVKQVFGSMLDFTAAPILTGLEPEAKALIDSVIAQANAQANAYALSQGIPVLDIHSFSQIMPTVTPATPFPLGGINFTSAYISDGFHPRPWVQGLLANIVSTAYNEQYDMELPLISDQKIVQNSGFSPSGPTSYYDVTPFVFFPVPEPASGLLAASASVLLGLNCYRRRKTGR